MKSRWVNHRIDIEPMGLIFILGLIVTLVVPRWMNRPNAIFSDAVVVLSIGLLCVVAAKISLFRRGVWVSWGPRPMSKSWARLYRVGYVFMGLGVFFLLLLAYRVAG
jgi:hypothetical protein